MRSVRVLVFGCGVLAGVTACVALAPGAEKVRITKAAADVSNCTAVGNIRVPTNADGSVNVGADREFRNQAVGLGANTAFETEGTLSVPLEGVAYRCP